MARRSLLVDPRPAALRLLLQTAFARGIVYIWGAGASASLVPLAVTPARLAGAVRRCRGAGWMLREPGEHEFRIMASLLGAPGPAGLLPHQWRDHLTRAASEFGLSKETFDDFLHLSPGGVSAVFGLLFSADPEVLRDENRRVGYDILRFVPAGTLVITANHDRLLRELAPHLEVAALHGEVDSLFVDPATRDKAVAWLRGAPFGLHPRNIVMAGEVEPAELVDTEAMDALWARARWASAIVFVGYRFAGGADHRTWDHFRRHVARTARRTLVVDPEASDVAAQVGHALVLRAPLAVGLCWDRMARAVEHCMRGLRVSHPFMLVPRTRLLVRVHDELGGDGPATWNAALERAERRMRPKTL